MELMVRRVFGITILVCRRLKEFGLAQRMREIRDIAFSCELFFSNIYGKNGFGLL